MKHLLLLLALTCGLLHADEPAKKPTLAEIQLFAFGGIGFAATTSQGELALRALMQQPDRKRRLDAILKKGTPEAKCYAIAAYKLLDKKKHEQLLEQFAEDDTSVTIMGGCIQSDFLIKEIIARMKKGLHQAPKSLKIAPSA